MENIHYNQMMIEAGYHDWKETVAEIIGDEPVEFRLHSRSFPRPIIKISSPDKSALVRVIDKAIEHADGSVRN